MAAEDVENLIERCLPHVLAHDGHAIYLRHPHTRETVLIAFHTSRAAVDTAHAAIRRVLLGIVREALEEAIKP